MIGVTTAMMISACVFFLSFGLIFGVVYLFVRMFVEIFLGALEGIAAVFESSKLKIREYIVIHCMKDIRLTFWQEEALLFAFIICVGSFYLIFDYVFLDGVIRILPAVLLILGIVISKTAFKFLLERVKIKTKFLICVIFGGTFFYLLKSVRYCFLGACYLKKSLNKLSLIEKLRNKVRKSRKNVKKTYFDRIN